MGAIPQGHQAWETTGNSGNGVSLRALQVSAVKVHIKGESMKTSLILRRTFGLISLPTNILEGWDIFHLKGWIHSSVQCTKTFLYDIREPIYKQIKMGYQISKIFDIGQSSILKSDVPYLILFYLYLRSLMFYRNWFQHA